MILLVSNMTPLLPSLRSAPPPPSSPPVDGGGVAGDPAAEREALWDAGGVCYPGDRGRPTAADRKAERCSSAGSEGQGGRWDGCLETKWC